MKYEKRIYLSIFWIVLGVVLIGCSFAGVIDDYWGSMGGALLVVGALQMIRNIRYRTNAEYREKFDVETQDERNRFIANKAWAWAGYWFVMIAAVATIVCKLLGREDLMMMASAGVCIMITLYWVCYYWLRKKY